MAIWKARVAKLNEALEHCPVCQTTDCEDCPLFRTQICGRMSSHLDMIAAAINEGQAIVHLLEQAHEEFEEAEDKESFRKMREER